MALFSVAAAELNASLFSDKAAGPGPIDPVSVHTAWSLDRARPGDRFGLAVVVDIRKGFHINADKEQIPTQGAFKPFPTGLSILGADKGLMVGSPVFPRAHPVKVQYAEEPLMLFDGRAIIHLPVTVGAQTGPGKLTLTVELTYQACDDKTCLFPKKIELKSEIPVVGGGDTVSAINGELFGGFEFRQPMEESDPVGFDLFGWRFSIETAAGSGFLFFLLVAGFGGMLLNFTPCVLPLVPIKIMSLSRAAQENRRRCILLGLSLFLGILVFWLVLGLMISLISGFTATNQLFQYPPFTIAIGVVIAVMGFGMFGMFRTRLPSFVYSINPSRESLPGSFVMGVLTAILSTPCTAPFMGAAAAWAATRDPSVSLLTFAAIGVGMALPYFVLSIRPEMASWLPRTGPGSQLLKEVMGLFMMAAAAYFIGSGLSAVFVTPPDPPSKLYWWAVAIVCAAAGLWLMAKTVTITPKKGIRTVFLTVGLIILLGSVLAGFRLTAKPPIDWVHYTPRRLETALGQGKSIVMVFTAEWCLNCKALEQGVFTHQRMVRLFSDPDVVPIKVDITGNNPAGRKKLAAVGSLTIPLLVVFSPDGKVVFKSDFYTVDQVLKAVDKTRISRKSPG